jgi:hypothetical protein
MRPATSLERTGVGKPASPDCAGHSGADARRHSEAAIRRNIFLMLKRRVWRIKTFDAKRVSKREFSSLVAIQQIEGRTRARAAAAKAVGFERPNARAASYFKEYDAACVGNKIILLRN